MNSDRQIGSATPGHPAAPSGVLLRKCACGNHTVAGILLFVQAEIGRTMHDELVEFLKAAFIQEEIDSFARRHLAGCPLLFDSFFAAAFFG